MRLLILDEWVPWPLDSGKKIRTFNIVKHLSSMGEVTYVCYENNETGEQLKEQLPGIRLVQVPDSRTKKGTVAYYLRVLRNVVERDPFAASYATTRAMCATVSRLLEDVEFDFIMCEWTPYSHYIADVTHPGKVLMTHNIEFLQWKRLEEASSNPGVRVLAGLQKVKMRGYERRIFPKFSLVAVVSESDRELLRSLSPNTDAIVVENGVDLDFFKTTDRVPRSAKAVFSASMDAFSNEDAVLFYAREIHPIVRKARKDAEFVVLGRNPSRKVREMSTIPGVIVTGTVQDVRPFIAESAVSVVPLRVGGGTRLKILESMSMGVPVVSTKIGAEGLAVEDGKHILIADDPEEFALKVVECLNDDSVAVAICESARQLVKSRYSWDSIGQHLVAHLESLHKSSR